MWKSLLILLSLLAGLWVPAAGQAQFLVRPFLVILLFFSFLGVALGRKIFAWRQLQVALLIPLIGLAAFALGNRYSPELGWILFVIAIAPTAIISPVLADIMRRKASYLIGSILVSHGVIVLILPVLIPRLAGEPARMEELGRLFLAIVSTVLTPLVAAQIAYLAGQEKRRKSVR
jgi:bile acid:Na+ symporter, BASS family